MERKKINIYEPVLKKDLFSVYGGQRTSVFFYCVGFRSPQVHRRLSGQQRYWLSHLTGPYESALKRSWDYSEQIRSSAFPKPSESLVHKQHLHLT